MTRRWPALTEAEKRQRNRAKDRARRGGRGYDGVTDEQIYRRDKWVCLMPECVCPDGAAIDPDLLGAGGPWAPSIDHITPLRDGGLDNSRNKRAAHQRCNNNANQQGQQDLASAGAVSRQPIPLTWTIGDILAAGDYRSGLVFATLEELRQYLLNR
jgi:5-methylcytosine-specific restriction endonuclease McrA